MQAFRSSAVWRGTLTDPDEIDGAVETIRESIETAAALGVSTLIATTGPEQDDLGRDVQREAVVDALSSRSRGRTGGRYDRSRAVEHGGRPSGTLSLPFRGGFAIVDDVGSPNVKLLYEFYHQQITEGT